MQSLTLDKMIGTPLTFKGAEVGIITHARIDRKGVWIQSTITDPSIQALVTAYLRPTETIGGNG